MERRQLWEPPVAVSGPRNVAQQLETLVACFSVLSLAWLAVHRRWCNHNLPNVSESPLRVATLRFYADGKIHLHPVITY